jgi:hypothetical protein
MLIDGMNTHLVAGMENSVPGDDPTKAGLVRPGQLQDNPIPWKIVVLTFANNPDSPEAWKHQITRSDVTSIKDPSPFDLVGGQMMYRRFVTTLEMFWAPNTTRQVARQQANVVLSRAESLIRSFSVNQQSDGTQYVDTFGEVAFKVMMISSYMTDDGGIGQFIHHAKINWQCLTGSNEFLYNY